MAIQTITELHERGVNIKSLTEPDIDTTTPMGRALFGIVAVFAQLRVDTIRDNTRRGLEHARAKGRLGGRPTVMSAERVAAAVQLRAAGTSITAIARTLGAGVLPRSPARSLGTTNRPPPTRPPRPTMPPDLLLRTFQRRDRVDQLHREGRLVADWSHVMKGTERAYVRMVEVMAARGIDTADHPPNWAWHGPLRLYDAALLFDPVHELSAGFATVTFSAPAELVLLCAYPDWCDVLMTTPTHELDAWQPQPPIRSRHHPDQACLPYLSAHWVRSGVPRSTATAHSMMRESDGRLADSGAFEPGSVTAPSGWMATVPGGQGTETASTAVPGPRGQSRSRFACISSRASSSTGSASKEL